MRKKNNLLYIALALASFNGFAQQSYRYTNTKTDFEHAVSLYKEDEFAIAQMLFDKIKQQNHNEEVLADCAYYIANCAIRLEQEGAEQKIHHFVVNYPTSSKQAQAYADISDYYFRKGDYEQSLFYANKINPKALTKDYEKKIVFYKAYGLFLNKDYSAASQLFSQLKDDDKFGNQAKYYLGYISYASDDYNTANQLFEEVGSQTNYADKMGYYKADMNFKAGAFEKAISEGLIQMSKASDEEKSELSKIIGESYFNLHKYNEAIPYLLAYKGKNSKWSNTDFYQLGYAYYKQNDYSKAIEEFNKIINGADAVAQNAYYHLGESYLKLDMKTQALHAFKNSSEMSFNERIQEGAFANYAKLSYEIGNPYMSTPEVINNFLKKYPNSSYNQELNELLIDAYISSKNYKEAYVLLEKNRTPQNKLAYQKVTFYRGLEFYGESKYGEALEMFKKSIAERQDNRFVARATYWKGEAEYALNQFSNAYQTFSVFRDFPQAEKTPEYQNIQYNLGYSAFKQKEYSTASKHFDAFVKHASDVAKRNDAYLRLADGEFVAGNYTKAMEAYNKVVESKSADAEYATYQKALSYGLMNKQDLKIKELKNFVNAYPKSVYADDSWFEIGATLANQGKSTEAVEAFDQLIKKYPSSTFVSKAILRQGLVYYNNNENTKALERFKKVVNDYAGSNDAIEAVKNARLIYLEEGKTAEFAAWAKSLNFVDVSNTELDNESYQTIERLLIENNNKQAIHNLNEYLKTFPSGLNALKAHFNLAELYFTDKQNGKAIPHYEAVLSKAKNEYTEQSLLRLSTIYLSEKSPNKAKSLLTALEIDSNSDQNKVFAQANLMRYYYDNNEFSNAVQYAEKVLINKKADTKMIADAQVIIARAAFETNDWTKARKAYQDLQKTATGELAAEALYYDAFFKHQDKKYADSNKVIEKLAKDYSGYKYFGAKGLIVMAKNFYGLKDSYQATYILESVISNFENYQDVVSEAKKELSKIKTEESKRNSSVK